MIGYLGSMVYPKIVKSVHYCPKTKRSMERRYTDMTSFDAYPSSSVYPTKDEDGNLLETEFGLCTYKNHQTLTVQEMPEKSPAGSTYLNSRIISLAKVRGFDFFPPCFRSVASFNRCYLR